ncbi:hypothetical protein [Actinomadura rudentiformis]|uniref:Uncharacterized protein n=1 Tax=Actinomadura rudentiformis TaxID=359158 RepID=A0A6H9Z4W3_9ACTN|nr:hypothetical protein [Actinomadura rudentiformis]KAB2350991.1 hypothetical protein F8566_08570 [Actinomadura rudentiformis]
MAVPPTPSVLTGPDGHQMTLISPSGSEEKQDTSWAVVLGLVLVGEVALLWGVACLGVLRRRLAARRPGSARRRP